MTTVHTGSKAKCEAVGGGISIEGRGRGAVAAVAAVAATAASKLKSSPWPPCQGHHQYFEKGSGSRLSFCFSYSVTLCHGSLSRTEDCNEDSVFLTTTVA